MNEKRVFLTKHSPEYWRVTLNHPPLNIFGPKTIPQLNEVITAIETDKELKVVVFDSDCQKPFTQTRRLGRADSQNSCSELIRTQSLYTRALLLMASTELSTRFLTEKN